MNWDQKVKMVGLSESGDTVGFNTYVLEHVTGFDAQDWDMFANSVTIDPEQIEKDSSFWDQMLGPMKEFLLSPESVESSFKGRIRVSVILEILGHPESSDI